jgi:hypothetical protein
MHARRDSGSIVVGWLTKVALVLTIFGLAAFDAISVGAAHLTGADDANNAASAAATSWRQTHQVQAAYDAARESIGDKDETILTRGFVIDANGGVQLLLARKATTLVMYRIGPLKKYTEVVISGEAPPATP